MIIAQSKDETMHVLRFAFDNYLSNASKLIEHAFAPINTQPDTIDFFRQRTSCDNQSTYFTATFRKKFLFLLVQYHGLPIPLILTPPKNTHDAFPLQHCIASYCITLQHVSYLYKVYTDLPLAL